MTGYSFRLSPVRFPAHPPESIPEMRHPPGKDWGMGEPARQEPASSGLVYSNDPAPIDASFSRAKDRQTALNYYTDIRFLIETFLSRHIAFLLPENREALSVRCHRFFRPVAE